MAKVERLPLATVKRYAYLNVIASFLVWGFALAGVSMMVTVSYRPIMQDMHWSNEQTTAFMAIKSLVSALTGLLIGHAFVKFGLKRVYVIALAAIGLSTSMLYFAHTLSLYYLAAAISGFFSIICNIAYQVTLARWFTARLGQMTGYAVLGAAFAALVVPVSTAYFVKQYGWHATFGLAGLFVLVVLTTLVALLAHESPERYGYTADEIDPPKAGSSAKSLSAGPPPGDEFKALLKSPRFYILCGCVFASGAFSNGINEHTTLFLAERHLGAYAAAGGFTLVMVLSALGKVFFGWLFDKISTKGIALGWALCGIAVALAFPVATLPTMVIFVAFRGIAQGGAVVQTPILARHMFGLRAVAQTISVLMGCFHLGAATGIFLIARFHDLTGGYDLPFVGIIILSFLAAAVALTFRPRYWGGYKGA
ncbi:MAG: MFS transporter [Sphingomonadales bacterium]|nr:MFS transporter [Sphingomonadales bacterium]MDE2170864.1 MFS transporter [Sphingomonadales bacterium]